MALETKNGDVSHEEEETSSSDDSSSFLDEIEPLALVSDDDDDAMDVAAPPRTANELPVGGPHLRREHD